MKFLIVDDHVMIRKGVRALLERLQPQAQVFESETVAEALTTLQNASIDYLVVDHILQNQTGLDLIEDLQQLGISVKTLLLTQCQDPLVLSRYQKLGVQALVAKQSTEADLQEALQCLNTEEVYVSEALREVLRESTGNYLTGREKEVMGLVAQGKSNKQVASELGCSVETVKTHKANIMRKIGVSNSIEITLWAVKQGLA